MSTYARRLTAARAELEAAGFWKSNSQPPFFRILRAVGGEPRPPHYVQFRKIWLWLGLYFSVVWGTLMHLVIWRDMPVWVTLIATSIAGALFGYWMAIYYKKGREKHALSDWDSL